MDRIPFFSVVMPVYNVAPYLEKAIESVINQSFTDFEIILVNDCSPDNSAEICKQYSEKYENIKVVTHEVNKGLSQARNTGFKEVTGKYVWFMDSDDYVDTDLFEKVYASLQQNSAQVVVFGCKEEYYDKQGDISKVVEMTPEAALCATEEELRKHILELELGTFYGYAWNKFYSTAHIRENQLKYENIVLIEDILFNVKYFTNIKSMNVLDITPYHYAKRGTNSLTAKFVPQYYQVHRERIRLLLDQQKQWGTAGHKEKGIIANIYTRYIFSAISRNCDKRAEMSHRARKNWLKDIYKDEMFCELIPYANPEGKVLKVMAELLKKNSVTLSLTLGRLIYIVQNNFRNMFVNIKQVRK